MSNSHPVALILGATGRTGSQLVNLLEKDPGSDNIEICVAVRKSEQAETFTKRGISTVHLDLDDLSTYEKALQGVQRLFMITGYTVDISEELDKIITYEPLPAADMRSLPIGQTMESEYFECIVRQMELLQAGKLPDFADVYDNIPQITGQKATMFREFVRNNRALFEVA